MPRFSVVYYSDGQLSEALGLYCLEVLAEAATGAGGEVLCVTWEPLPETAGEIRNIVWPTHESTHRNMYQQILAGISEADSDVIMLAEHDVLYPSGYHDVMAAASGSGLCYNTHVWCLNALGFFKPGNCHLLSNCAGMRDSFIAGIQDKLAEIRIRGGVVWAEPPGDTEISTPHPAIDIRHGRNFTGGREAPEGRYQGSIEYWGSASVYTRLFAPAL